MTRTILAIAFLGPIASCSLITEEDKLRRLWKVDEAIESTSLSSEMVTDGERFYTIRDRDLVAYATSDGAEIWRQSIRQDCKRVMLTAARVFCPSRALYVFEAATGATLWTLPSDTTLSQVQGTAGAERVFAATITTVTAADAATGIVHWRRRITGPGWVNTRIRSLTLSDGELLAATEGWYNENGYFSSAAIVALDPATGAERWRFEDGGPTTDRSIGGLTVWNGLLLYTDGHGNENAAGGTPTAAEAVAVDRATREVRWRYPFEPGWLGTLSPPMVADGVAFFTDAGGNVYAADATTGAPRWHTDSGAGHFSHILCGPYVLANDGGVRVLDRATGTVRERLFDGTNEIALQLAVADAHLYVGTTRGVYAFACE